MFWISLASAFFQWSLSTLLIAIACDFGSTEVAIKHAWGRFRLPVTMLLALMSLVMFSGG
jgi:hypothetical protein